MRSQFKYGWIVMAMIIVSICSHAQGLKDTVMNMKDVYVIAKGKDTTSHADTYTKIKTVTIFDNLDLQNSSGKRISDALSEITPVFLKSYGVGQLNSLSINGSSAAQVNVSWNGIKINSPTTGQVDLSLFDFGTIDNLTVYTGGKDNSIGGRLELSNEQISPSDTFLSKNIVRYGSFKSLNIGTNNQYRVGKWTGSTRVTYIRSDNDFSFKNTTKLGAPTECETNAATSFLSFMQQLNYNFNASLNAGANFWVTDADRQLPPIMAKDRSSQREYDQSYRAMAYINGEKKHFLFSFKTAYIYDHLRYTDPLANIDSRSSAQASRSIFTIDYKLKEKLRFELQPTFDFERAVSTGFATPQQRAITGLGFTSTYYYNTHSRLSLSLKQELLNTTALPFTPYLSWSYSKSINNHHLIWSAVAARSYRVPSLNDLFWSSGGNPNLKTEKAWNGFVSMRYNYSSYVRFMVYGFCNYVNDWILWHPEQSGIWTPDNVKRVLSRGVSVNLKLENESDYTSKRFIAALYLSYTYTKTTSLNVISSNDNSIGKQLIYVPIHNASATIQIQYWGFYIRSINSFSSRRYTTTDNSQSLAGFYLCHIEAGKDFNFNKQRAGISFRINNITDNQYQVVEQIPMPGRSYEVTIKLNLAK